MLPDPAVAALMTGAAATDGCEAEIVAVAETVPEPLALFALTVTAYTPDAGRLAAGTVQLAPVQASVVAPTFQTYAVGLLLQVAVSNGDAEPSVTDGAAGEIALHTDRGSVLTFTTTLAGALVPLALVPVTV